MKHAKYIAIAVILVILAGIYWYTRSKSSETSEQTSASEMERVAETVMPQEGDSGDLVDPSDMIEMAKISPTQIVSSELSQDEELWLMRMREEEMLAQDVYEVLYTKWKLPVFLNISRSEITHTSAVLHLIDAYGLQDPYTAERNPELDVVPVDSRYRDAEFNDLYVTLTEEGLQSLEQALYVSATIEELDIVDLDKAMAVTESEIINDVYANLQKGSRNHLRSFVTNLESRDVTYEPQYLERSVYDQIISTEREKGYIKK